MTTPFARFGATLAALLLALLCLYPAAPRGDFSEYVLTAAAVANHGTPDIRAADIARARALLPGRPAFDLLEQSMATPGAPIYPAFARARDGKVYQIHFIGYPLLAAMPFKVLARAGLDPLKGFQVLNLAMLFVLGAALYAAFGTAARAFAGLALFMLSGGALFWTWTSPECLSAAALLAALLLSVAEWPLAAALLAGLAAQQNPTIVFFFGFAPLLRLCLHYQPGLGLRANLAPLLRARELVALAAGLALAALPVAFNLIAFGVPNLIAARFSDPHLIGPVRLISFFFDLNQGVIIGIPAVLAMLALWGWRAHAGSARRAIALTAAGAAFTLALALPALAVLNWNSDAAGLMRYAFWAPMPLLFVLLLRLRARARWPRAALAAVMLAQALAMTSARSYDYVHFSPLAALALRYAPTHYHPEPEIFAERSAHNDDYIPPTSVFRHSVDGQAVTTLYNARTPGIDEQLCGKGAAVSPRNAYTASRDGWRYLHGAVLCVSDGAERVRLGLDQLRQPGVLADGWNAPEAGGGNWDGAWSEGPSSRIVVALAPGWRPATLTIAGMYSGANTRTRVRVNGVDLGWHALDQPAPIALPAAAVGGASATIELAHEDARALPGPDLRKTALFLHEVNLR